MGSSASDLGAGRPVIGLTTYLQRAQTGVWDVSAALLPEVYLTAVEVAGGTCVLLPPQPFDDAVIARVLDGIDGLIVTGGRDVESTRYGQEPHPAADAPSPLRDDWEDALLTAAIAREQPFFGICRGLQVLNVARGGTLHQHLPDVIGSTRYNAGGGVFTRNEVGVEPGTRLADLLGTEPIEVPSYHHQAIDAVGAGLRVTARSDDGVVQAVELPGASFAVAVQWHPEEDARADARLFAGLVAAARDYRKARA